MNEDNIKPTNREKKLVAKNKIMRKHSRNLGNIYSNAIIKRVKENKNASEY